MRRLVAVVIMLVLAITLVACGGGAEEPPADDAATPATPAPPTAVSEDDARPDYSPEEEQLYEPFPTDEEVLPQAIAERLEADAPMIVYFYDTSQKTTDDQDAWIERVMNDYRGLIDLVSFDVGKYVSTDESGAITVKSGLEDDETARQVAQLMGQDYLDVKFTPYLVLVDEDGYMTYRFRGPVDDKTLEREVLRATE